MEGAGTHNAKGLLNEAANLDTVSVALLLWMKAHDGQGKREGDAETENKWRPSKRRVNKAFTIALSPAVQDIFPEGNVAFLQACL